MRALQLTAFSGPDALEVADVGEPVPAEGQVLIDVHAAGVSFADLLMTRGRYQVKPELPFVPGLEVAGVVRQAPPDAPLHRGQSVAAHVFGGAFAEVAVADPHVTLPLPEDMDFAVAAGFVVNYQTAYFVLARRARLGAGETVLVHGAGGGVGTASVAVASAMGARVLAVAGGEDKREAADGAGAEQVFDAADDWPGLVRDATGGRGVDVVIDPVGGDRFNESLRSMAPEGRLVVVGFASGEIPTAAANRLLLRNIGVLGAAWREFLDTEPPFARDAAVALNRLVDAGRLQPPQPVRYPLEQGATALRDLEGRRAVGKLVLEVS